MYGVAQEAKTNIAFQLSSLNGNTMLQIFASTN
jgi:hypothetical protein